jgi:CubicO group peptidase (beta-lactamase class C family)
MAETPISGLCPPRFAAVRRAFEANFAEGLELGARFAFAIEGEIVVDLIGGWTDRAQTRPFSADTLTSVFSTTKAIAAFMIARLVDQVKLSYGQRVAEIWPQFAAQSKAFVTVEQVMAHQAGLPGFAAPMPASDWFEWDLICERLAAMAPMWKPGDANGYHPVTFGYLAGEIFRRIDGRTMGQALRQDIAEPLGLDLWIGVPDAEHYRCADVRRPAALPNLGEINEFKRVAFLTPWASPGGRSLAEWRRAEIPSVTGHATAPALAQLMAAMANGGSLRGVRLLKPETVEAATAPRSRGQDLVLPYDLAWGAGFLRNEGLNTYGPGQETIGHSGWGGSCAFADPERGVSGAYVMNRQSPELITDARARRLIEAAYREL